MAIKNISDAFVAAFGQEAPDQKPPSGDAIELLKADHRKVEKLFEEVLAEKSSALTGKQSKIDQILSELTLHAKVEETLVYPATFQKTKRDTGERLEVLEAIEEHGAMKDLMRKISRAPRGDESLKAKVQVLCEIVSHHVKEEETTFFPEVKRLLGEDRLEKLGTEIVRLKARSKRAMPKANKKQTHAKQTNPKQTNGKPKGSSRAKS
jgi:hemerythrin superfamily protein